MPATEYTTRKKITLGQDNNALTWLLIINAVIFIILNFIKVIYQLGDGDNNMLIEAFHKEIVTWFVLPASGSELLYKPFTIITYMFTQVDVLQAISNMLWLWCFGYILQDLAGNNKLIPVYIYGGLAGAIIFILSCNFIPSLTVHLNQIFPLTGAGCSVMAVAVATTTMTPNYRIFPLLNGGIPLWVLTLIFIIIDLTTVGSAGLAFSHIAGGLIPCQALVSHNPTVTNITPITIFRCRKASGEKSFSCLSRKAVEIGVASLMYTRINAKQQTAVIIRLRGRP